MMQARRWRWLALASLCGVSALGPGPARRAAGRRPGGPTLGGPVDATVPPSVPTEAATPELVVDLSLPRVSITSAFQGESILLFGMFDPPGEIVVVVAGPPARETVLRKERFLGLWLNIGRQSFDDVPAYYAIAASQPLQRLLAAWRRRRDPVPGRSAGTIRPVASDLPSSSRNSAAVWSR